MNSNRGVTRLYNDEPGGWADAATYNVWAANCVQAIADAVALVPLKLYKRPKGKTDKPKCVDEHPVLDLLRTINPYYLDEASFKRAGMEQLNVFGQWLIYKLRDESGGEPLELHILPSMDVDMRRDERGYPEGYTYLQGEIYPIDDVIRIYYPSLRDPFVAQSPTSRAVAAINRYALADMAQEAIDKNGGKGGGFLSPDFNMIEGDPQQFMAAWNAKNRDTERMADDRFLPPGFDYKTGQLTALEQQREQRSMRLMNEIMAAYGVPPAVAGDYSDASKLANADAQMTQFWRGKIVPLAQKVAESFNNYLLWSEYEGSKDEGLYLAFCFDEVEALQEDEQKRAEVDGMRAQTAVTKLQGGITTVNEAREESGLERIEGNPSADDVTLIVNGGTQPDAAPDTEGGTPATASSLSSSQLVNIRGVAESFASGGMTDRQARAMLRVIAPSLNETDINDFLARETDRTIDISADAQPGQDAPAGQPKAAGGNGIAQARVIAAQFRKGDLDREQAETMMRLAMPDIDDATLEILLKPPAPVEQDAPEDDTEEEDMGIDAPTLTALQTVVDNLNAQLISEDQAEAMVTLLLPNALPSQVAGLLELPDDPEAEPLDPEEAAMEAEAEQAEDAILAALDAVAMAEDEADDEEDMAEGEADSAEMEDPAAAKAGNTKRDQGGKFSSVEGAPIDRVTPKDGKRDIGAERRQAIIDRASAAASKKGKGRKGRKGRKPKKTEEQKAAEREKKRQERLTKAVNHRAEVDDALKKLEGNNSDAANAAREKLDKAAELLDKQIDRLNKGAPEDQVASALAAAGAVAAGKALIPLFDWVGCKAFGPDGAELGVIEKVERFADPKNPRPIEPSKNNPIISIAGEWRHAADVRVMLEA
jgi:HK97 family phage portal protein